MTFQQPPYEPPGGPYGQPGYPYGPYGQQPGQYGQPYPPPAQTTNGLAIAALVCGILGFTLVGIVLGVIFGIIALSQTKDGRQAGRGLAIAGLVLSGCWALFYVGAIIIAIATDDGSVRATDVKTGDCIEASPVDMEQVLRLPKVACDQPHEGEVYALVRVVTDDFPGQSILESEYRDRCVPALAVYSPGAATDPDVQISVLYPTRGTWDQGDRDVVCIAVTEDKRTGSIKE